MKKKGFTMIEVVIIVAIVGILAVFGTLRISGRAEKNAMITFKGKAPEFIRVTTQRAFEEGEDYTIDIDAGGKTIKRKNSSGTLKEEIFLPEVLEYEIQSTSGDAISVKVDDRGQGYLVDGPNLIDLNKNIFVFNSKDKALYKMRVFSDTPIMYLRVETSLPIGNVDKSNYANDNNWEKE